MRRYWRIIQLVPGIRGGMLRLHLLTGGQRIAQLARLKTADIKGGYFVLYDGKGRPPAPARVHYVPLTDKARQALADCQPVGEFALSNDEGKTAVAPTTVSDWARLEAGGLIKSFTLKRVRSGVETLLSMHDVNKEIRGHLLSHGRGGVQETSYDANDFYKEKLAALETLIQVLEDESP
jgi:integrase